MLDPARLHHAYDLRGQVGIDISTDDFLRLGRAIARHVRREGGRSLVVAFDGRLSSPDLARALLEGLLVGGIDVLDLGLTPTPLAYFAERHLAADGAAIITASHNPATWNGLKLVLGGAVVCGEPLAAIVREALGDMTADGPPGHHSKPDPIPAYLDRLGAAHPLPRSLRVGLDAMHGAAGPLALRLLEGLGARVVPLHCAVDGRFPDGPPDPSQAKNLTKLARTVVEQSLDLGLALDGDGDRLVVMDGRGEVIAPDRLLVLFAREALRTHPGGIILMDVKGSRASRRAIEAAGGRVEIVPSGHANMRAALRRVGALLGGELSGHLFFADNGYDDGLDAAVRLLRLLAAHPEAPTVLFDSLPRAHATPELLLPRPAHLDLPALLDALAVRLPLPHERLLRIDGLRLESPEGFILVRASNTQPLLSLRIEGEDETALARLKSRLSQAWPDSAPGLPHPF
ncbi:MAG: phosphomannomutase/phosphoglucomutase [Halothiobacillaceae bacterium]